MTEKKTLKDDYQKALSAYGQAVKEFHKGDMEKAGELLASFVDKYASERELVDRARVYLAIAQKRQKREVVHLKTFEDHYLYGVYKINQGDYEGALKTLEKALEFKTDEGKIYYLMADAYCLMGQVDPCLDNLKKAVAKDKVFAVLAQNETDFAAYRDDKRFKLIAKLT